MKNNDIIKDKIKSKNIILILTSVFILFIGISFFFSEYITYFDGNQIFYIAMLLYFGAEFTNYLLTRKETGLHSLYTSLACIIASVSGLLYMDEKTNMVLSITIASWMVIMVVIKLIKIEELRNEMNYSIFINIFSLSLFILLGFLCVTNLYRSINNPCLILGFFFTTNGILNMIETIGNIKFCK